jgi:hypothetical protein
VTAGGITQPLRYVTAAKTALPARVTVTVLALESGVLKLVVS